MKIIELLNRIYTKSNLPPTIFYEGATYKLENYKYIDEDGYQLGYRYKLDSMLNDEVGIPMEENIEKLEINYDNSTINGYVANGVDIEIAIKINNILDKVNKNE